MGILGISGISLSQITPIFLKINHFLFLSAFHTKFEKVPTCPQSPKSPYTPFPQNPQNPQYPQYPHNGDIGDFEDFGDFGDFNPQTTKKMLTKIAFQKAACKGQALRVLK